MRRGHHRLVAVLAAAAIALTAAGATAQATQAAEPLDWTVAAGFPVELNDATVILETTIVPAADAHTLEPYPIQRINIVNDSNDTRYFSFGIDIETQSVIEPMWEPETLGESEPDPHNPFVVRLSPGEAVADTPGALLYYGTTTEAPGLPVYPGRTAVVYELSHDPLTDPDDVTATELARVTTPGGFVPVDVDGEPTAEGTVPAGVPVTVLGPSGGGDVQLFPGVTASATASGLPPNLDVELWLAPSSDYFFFLAGGSQLPDNAYPVGTATTTTEGSLDTAFEVPAGADFDLSYRLFVGVPEDRYWPAGTYRRFEITSPQESDAATPAHDDTSATLNLGATSVQFAFPEGTGGTWTGAVSTTGPSVNDFTFASDPPLYYHLDTDATLTEPVTVCITYSVENFPGAPPRIFHYYPTAPDGLHRWVDITSDPQPDPQPGRVCGETSSLSPFALGYPIDDGSATPPAKGELHSDNGWDTGLQDGDYNIVMDLRAGENARIVRLLEGGIVIALQTLTLDSPNPQQATFPISGRRNGTYTYTAELENSRGVTTTRTLTVKIAHATPAQPILKATSPEGGTFTVTASMWWGTNATSYRFLQNGVQVASGPLIADSPNPQFASLSRTGLPKGTYTYVVEFTNAAGISASAPLAVKVK